ncbi:hypothetical protein [Paenibacillus sp. PAMC21692]|uniref:hypothetical protein n=1 Tax=Paenibacillus sp. PAMC21692 TaxID=2762320 RepID=UPI00164DD5F6|nr:hypothetical protein [Paenibacillus sp. PAMC21692]QNK57011.1 hypothetical protein H7F31_31710 [Paenibacillus sp. PAMC21692]
MNKRLKFSSFWSINDALDLGKLQCQLDELQAAGLDGVVFHPRYYPNEPGYMSPSYLNTVSDLILYARDIGMEFWLYDENGWPSGTAGGEVMNRRPDLACEWLEYGPLESGEFGITICSHPGVSSFQAEAAALFIEITHEGYRKGLKPEAFDYVEGFFSDEVGFLDGHGVTVSRGGVPWDKRFPAMYETRYGEVLEPLLPLLFVDGAEHEQVRARFWEMLTDALIEGFYQPIGAWCQAHGKRFTAHLKAEEHPYFQLTYSGSCFQVLKGIETPAIDALERFPGNHFYPRLLHSVAVQQGRDGCLVEAMGGSGWGVTPQSFTDYIMWLAGHGIDQYVLHLNQFKLKTQAVQDWPPSMPCHLTWKDAFAELLKSIRTKAAGLPDLHAEPELLIVVPTRGIMASFLPEEARQLNEHDGSNVPDSPSGRWNDKLLRLVEACYAAGIHYELTEERVVETEGQVLPGKLRIGSRHYRTVVLAEGCLWNDPKWVSEAAEAGIQVREATTWHPDKATIEPMTAKALPELVPEQSAWHAELPKSNQLLIPFLHHAEAGLQARILFDGASSFTGLRIVLHDEVEETTVNGIRLELRETESGYEASVPDDCVGDKGELLIGILTRGKGEQNPLAFLTGRFCVGSLSPYTEKDGTQWMTEGEFRLTSVQPLDCSDLISSGLPFSGTPVQVTKELKVESSITAGVLQLTDVHAAAAQIWLGELALGWCWGPEWRVKTGRLDAGNYPLTVSLYPSTYNVYGPHRHVDGDRHLTSPGQYEGVKNFADRADAPERTTGTQWHFVKWGIKGDVRLFDSPSLLPGNR